MASQQLHSMRILAWTSMREQYTVTLILSERGCLACLQAYALRSNGCFNKTSRRNGADVTVGMARFTATVQGSKGLYVYASICERGILDGRGPGHELLA